MDNNTVLNPIIDNINDPESPIHLSLFNMNMNGEIEDIEPNKIFIDNIIPNGLSNEINDRSSFLEMLVKSRKNDFEYLIKIFNGQTYWLNIVYLSRDDIIEALNGLSDKNYLRKRCAQFFYFGISLGKILDLKDFNHIMKGCSQLFEELDYHFSNSTIKNMKLLVATNDGLYTKVINSFGNEKFNETSFKPNLKKWNQKIVYQRLYTPEICMELDICEVTISLCNILIMLYSHFLEEKASSNMFLFQAIVQIDERIKKFMIDRIIKHLTIYSEKVVQKELDSLLT